jgi:hypothetical protein
MNWPSCTGNAMLSVVRVAMCSSTSKRVTQYMHSLDKPTVLNLAGSRMATGAMHDHKMNLYALVGSSSLAWPLEVATC